VSPKRTPPEERAQRELDTKIMLVHAAARVLPALVPDDAEAERRRIVAAVARGEAPTPGWKYAPRRTPPEVRRALAEARALAPLSLAADLYLARLDELELDLQMLESLGHARRVRPLAARRYGTGATLVSDVDGRTVTAAEAARAILRSTPPAADTAASSGLSRKATLPPDATGKGPSVAAVVRAVVRAAGLDAEVRVEPGLAASAAAGERTVLLAARPLSEHDAVRVALHEVLGHLTAAANARVQPLRLLEVGTAGCFGDQEGVALAIEESSGLLDSERVRTLAARVLATDRLHSGAPFGETALRLVRDHGFSPAASVAITERAYRGGGVARDAAYLVGWWRVRAAIAEGRATLDELRIGRVGVADIARVRTLIAARTLVASAFRPSLERARRAALSVLRPQSRGAALARV
jgi:hypothetical protein